MRRAIWPLLLLLVLAGFLAVGLSRDPRQVPSPLVNRAVPAFVLPTLDDPQRVVGPASWRGQPHLIHVWASWCAVCQSEHPVLMDLARSGLVAIHGLSYKDDPALAIGWLARHGNPYAEALSDRDGQVGLDLGVYGVPETYLVDRDGVIRFKHSGALTPEVLDTLLPMLGVRGG